MLRPRRAETVARAKRWSRAEDCKGRADLRGGFEEEGEDDYKGYQTKG